MVFILCLSLSCTHQSLNMSCYWLRWYIRVRCLNHVFDDSKSFLARFAWSILPWWSSLRPCQQPVPVSFHRLKLLHQILRHLFFQCLFWLLITFLFDFRFRRLGLDHGPCSSFHSIFSILLFSSDCLNAFETFRRLQNSSEAKFLGKELFFVCLFSIVYCWWHGLDRYV